MRRDSSSERSYDPKAYLGPSICDSRPTWEEGMRSNDVQSSVSLQRDILGNFAFSSSLRKSGEIVHTTEPQTARPRRNPTTATEKIVPWHTRTMYDMPRPGDPLRTVVGERSDVSETAPEPVSFDLGTNIIRREKRWTNFETFEEWSRKDKADRLRQARQENLKRCLRQEEHRKRREACDAAFQAFVKRARRKSAKTDEEKARSKDKARAVENEK